MRGAKIGVSILTILLAAASIGAATLAWFTDGAETRNDFAAGTVSIRPNGPAMPEKRLNQTGIPVTAPS